VRASASERARACVCVRACPCICAWACERAFFGKSWPSLPICNNTDKFNTDRSDATCEWKLMESDRSIDKRTKDRVFVCRSHAIEQVLCLLANASNTSKWKYYCTAVDGRTIVIHRITITNNNENNNSRQNRMKTRGTHATCRQLDKHFCKPTSLSVVQSLSKNFPPLQPLYSYLWRHANTWFLLVKIDLITNVWSLLVD